jgi:hypothetical protein
MKMNGIKAVSAAGTLGALLMASSGSWACTTDAWTLNGSVTGSVTAGGPDDAIARYSGVCAMETPDAPAQAEYVRNDDPGGIARIRARFYVLTADGTSGDFDVYRGLDAPSGSDVFTVRLSDLDGTTGDVQVLDDSLTPVASCTDCFDVGFWASIEIDWNSGGGNVDLWVNADAEFDPASGNGSIPTGNAVASVQLGNLAPANGALTFDAYESRRTTAIGRLCVGDANGDGTRGISDLEAIFNDFQFDQRASGNPDADENGTLGISDLERVFQIFQFETAECPRAAPA